MSFLLRSQQDVAVKTQQHGQADRKLSQGGAFYEGLQCGWDWGEGNILHAIIYLTKKKKKSVIQCKHIKWDILQLFIQYSMEGDESFY